MDEGFDPISLDKVKLKEWLKDDAENIVIFLDESIKHKDKDKVKILCLKKSYFLNPHMNDIYKKCVIENNALMVKETYEKPIDFRNIGFYMNKYLMIDNKEFIETLKKGRVFDLKMYAGLLKKINDIKEQAKDSSLESDRRDAYEDYLRELINEQNTTEFISQEALELSQIGLKPDNMMIQTKKIWALYPPTHPVPGNKFVVKGYEDRNNTHYQVHRGSISTCIG